MNTRPTNLLPLFAILFMASVTTTPAQTLYTPGGTVGTSSNGNVGIGTASPVDALDVASGALRVRGAATTGAASTAVLDFYNGSTRLISAGANTSTKGAFQFYVANSNSSSVIEAVRIDTAGNVGIGTPNPLQRLSVIGAAASTALFNVGKEGDYYGGWLGGSQDNDPHVWVGDWYSVGGGLTWDSSDDNLLLDTYSSSQNILMGNVGGNVGIGIASPGAKLDVVGTTRLTDAAQLRDSWFPYSNKWSYVTGDGIIFRRGGDAGFAERMRVDSNGNVGIGTTSPTHPLTVNGTIKAEEVIVEAGIAANDITIRPKAWADDVFEAGYHLRSLGEVEAHIQTEGRLPGVPSANEVAANGVSVADMQSTLLRKLEEVTLHLIHLEKENMALREEMEALKQKVNR